MAASIPGKAAQRAQPVVASKPLVTVECSWEYQPASLLDAMGKILLQSDLIRLRLVQERDLDEFYVRFNDLAYRGFYFPFGMQSEAKLRRDFAENGFWDKDEGLLLVVTPEDEMVGEIEFFPITHYLVGYELSYLIFGSEHAGKGYATEAVRLLSRYLFGRLRINRLQLNIHPDNEASRRVATKAGYTQEGVMRGCWFHRGRYHDLEIWSVLRDEIPEA